MSVLSSLVKRNTKLFFRDKGMFFTSLITPMILLVLYATFLSNVYRDSFTASFPQAFSLSEDLLDGLVGGQLISSLLAVSCVTVAFCSNMLIAQDKSNGSIRDLTISPVKPSTLAFGYYLSALISTLTIAVTALLVCLVYVAFIGWYLSALDVLLLFLDVVILVVFGTALSSLVNFFLSTQGQISAVGSIVSAGYGFICGAYMPISSFSDGMQTAVSCLPGTYGTALMRNHAMGGVFEEMLDQGLPEEVVNTLMEAVDCRLYFFDNLVDIPLMYLVVGGSAIVFMALCLLLHMRKGHAIRRG